MIVNTDKQVKQIPLIRQRFDCFSMCMSLSVCFSLFTPLLNYMSYMEFDNHFLLSFLNSIQDLPGNPKGKEQSNSNDKSAAEPHGMSTIMCI